MKTKHTPGPWIWTTADAGSEDEYGCSTRGPANLETWDSKGYYDNLQLCAGVDGDYIVSAGGGEYCPVHGNTKEERAANARLIAAAPDLLAALEKLLSYSSVRNAIETEDLQAVEHAIARATGGA